MENNQELMAKLQMFEQQIQQMQKQIQAVEEAIMDLNELNLGLDELVGAKGKEIMAPVGRGIFARANLVSEDLMVEIGGKNLVKKSVPQTKEIISEQLTKLENIREEIRGSIEQLNSELTKTMMESQNSVEAKHEYLGKGEGEDSESKEKKE